MFQQGRVSAIGAGTGVLLGAIFAGGKGAGIGSIIGAAGRLGTTGTAKGYIQQQAGDIDSRDWGALIFVRAQMPATEWTHRFF